MPLAVSIDRKCWPELLLDGPRSAALEQSECRETWRCRGCGGARAEGCVGSTEARLELALSPAEDEESLKRRALDDDGWREQGGVVDGGDPRELVCSACGHTYSLIVPACPECYPDVAVRAAGPEGAPEAFPRPAFMPAGTVRTYRRLVASVVVAAGLLSLASFVFEGWGPQRFGLGESDPRVWRWEQRILAMRYGSWLLAAAGLVDGARRYRDGDVVFALVVCGAALVVTTLLSLITG